MKIQKASFGIIKRTLENGREEFLLRLVGSWGNVLNLIGGKGEAGESPRDTAIRELNEELHLEYEADYRFDEDNQITVELVQFSQREQMEKLYRFSLFPVQLLKSPDEIERKFLGEGGEPKCFWVTLEEIMDEKTVEGISISDTVRKVFQESDKNIAQRLIERQYAGFHIDLGKPMTGETGKSCIWPVYLKTEAKLKHTLIAKVAQYDKLTREKDNFEKYIRPLGRIAFFVELWRPSARSGVGFWQTLWRYLIHPSKNVLY
jgi:8-oxo-dGTP pyrophosphatase MutT (NUDIX family)